MLLMVILLKNLYKCKVISVIYASSMKLKAVYRTCLDWNLFICQFGCWI